MAGVLSFLNCPLYVPAHYQRPVQITNVLSLIFAWVALGIFAFYYYWFGWLTSSAYIILVAIFFVFVIAINRWFSHRFGRVVFCLIPVWLTLFISVYFKLTEDTAQSYIFYFDSRFILLTTTILPGIVFRLEERLQLSISLGSTFLCIAFYDPVHQFFGAGYFQKGFDDISYYYINYITVIMFFVLLFGILLMRSVLERSEANLEYQNRELQRKQDEIEAQHEELLQQQEEVLSGSEKLEQANRLIMQQQAELEIYNAQLEALVDQKKQELVRTNAELVKHNNELLQFSYTVSHNFRGPVARLLGLTRLFRLTEDTGEKQELEKMIVKSSEELDEILKDLSHIIDLRNDLYRVSEKIILQPEFERALRLLDGNVSQEYQINMDFSEAPVIFGVRPMMQSIFYNLLSNAIKYQSPERPLEINIRSLPLSGMKTMLEIADNGLGIDLITQGNNIFKLYKRFHQHVQGKGLGLYLVKTQVEAMGGEIMVDSALNKGTTFKLVFGEH